MCQNTRPSFLTSVRNTVIPFVEWHDFGFLMFRRVQFVLIGITHFEKLHDDKQLFLKKKLIIMQTFMTSLIKNFCQSRREEENGIQTKKLTYPSAIQALLTLHYQNESNNNTGKIKKTILRLRECCNWLKVSCSRDPVVDYTNNHVIKGLKH